MGTKEAAVNAALAFVFAYAALLLWQWITAWLCGMSGFEIRTVFMTVTGIDAKWSALMLGISAILYFGIACKFAGKTYTALLFAATLILCCACFFFLKRVDVETSIQYAWFHENGIRFKNGIAAFYGIGSVVLLGLLCFVSSGETAAMKILNKGIVAIVFLVFSVAGSYIGMRVLAMGIAGCPLALMGAAAAIVAAALICMRARRVPN